MEFQHTAARRRLNVSKPDNGVLNWFQHTAARRRLTQQQIAYALGISVSTHSRSKAAETNAERLFVYDGVFQHTAARRRLSAGTKYNSLGLVVSTHSRSKAADYCCIPAPPPKQVSTHSRSKAAEYQAGRIA